jgi:hypothetical protein
LTCDADIRMIPAETNLCMESGENPGQFALL